MTETAGIRPGQRIGLLGGSFDPPHEGHVLITREALKRFALDEVWWLVSPGNPLKTRGPAPMAARVAAARRLIRDPRVKVSDLEARLGTVYTADTLRALARRHRGVRFVWLMGADSMADLHHWQNWRWIIENVPLGILARPGQRISARMSKAARCYRQGRLRPREAALLAASRPPAWCLVNVPMNDVSSSEIRARGGWRDGLP